MCCAMITTPRHDNLAKVLSNVSTSCWLPLLLLLLLCHTSTAQRVVNNKDLSCYECGVVVRTDAGSVVEHPCINRSSAVVPNQPPKVRKNCAACMKTYTILFYDYRKPRWGADNAEVVEISRFCLRDFEPFHPIGTCERNWGSGSYSERCYCNTNFCNSSPHPAVSAPGFVTKLTSLLLTLVFVFFR